MASLTKQAIALQLRGMNTRSANALRVPGELERAENVYMDKAGELRKRNGSTSLSTTADNGPVITTGTRLSSVGDGLVFESGSAAYARSTQGSGVWARVDTAQDYSVDVRPLTNGGGLQFGGDVVYNSGYYVASWVDGTTCYCSVQEESTGAYLMSAAVVGTVAALYPTRLVNVGTRVMIFYVTSGGLLSRTIDTATPGVLSGNAVVYVSQPPQRSVWDAAPHDSTYAKVMVCYNGTLSTKLWSYLGVAGTTTTSAVFGAANQCQGASWMTNSSGDGNHYIAAAFIGPSIRSIKLNSSLTLVSDTQITSSLTISGAGAVNVTAAQPTGFYDGAETHIIAAYSAAATISGEQVNVSGYWQGTFQTQLWLYMPASKIITYAGKLYVLMLYSHSTLTTSITSAQPHYALYNMTDKVYHGTILVTLATTSFPSLVTSFEAGPTASSFVTQVLRRTRMGQNYSSFKLAVAATTQTLSNALVINMAPGLSLGTCANAGSVMFMPSGAPRIYDGAGYYQINPLSPEKPVYNTSIIASPANLVNGSYQWVATCEWYDATGNLHRTPPSIPVSVTTTTTSVGFNIQVSNPTSRPMTVCLWRTKANGVEFQKCVSTATVAAHTAAMVQIGDGSSDTTLGTAEFLYTTGGTLENGGPPPCRVAVAHGGRMWVASSEYDGELWYSKPYETNICLEFNGLLSMDVGQPSEGRITALASLDDKLIVFKKGAIYYITGDGPDNTGAAGEFADPVRIPTSLGTTAPRSVVSTPDGVMFQDVTGQIWLLSRGLDLSYVGAGVKDYETQVVTGAVLVSAYNQVRFTCSSGYTLVYDRLNQQWFAWSGMGSSVGACSWRGVHHWVSGAGVVMYETPGVYADGASSIVSTVRFAPIQLSGLGGFARLYDVYLTGERRGAHSLTMRLYYDYSTSVGDTETITPGAGTFTLQGKPSRQRCSAVQVELYDTPMGAVDGYSLQAVTLNAGAKGRLTPNPTGNLV